MASGESFGGMRPEMLPEAAGHPHILCLDGLRAASILLVVLGHTLALGPAQWSLNSATARMGMALFFCLSGYLIISMLYRDPDVRSFLVKRVFRILPAVWLYLTVLLLFFDLPFESYLLNLAFVSNYFTEALDAGPVSHLWSLCVEIQFYLAIAFFVAVGGRQAVWLVVPATLAVTAMRIEGNILVNINTHLRADELLVGGCLALLSIHRGERLRGMFANRALAAGVVIALVLLFAISAHDEGGALVYLRPYFAMMLVGVIMHSDLRPLLWVLESRPARYIAKISYALYIWHPLMVFGWMNSGSTLERYLLKRPVSWAGAWLAAHLSTTYWEKYWQNKARRIVQGHSGKRTAPAE